MKTGNTWTLNDSKYEKDLPQWSPVMKTGNTSGAGGAGGRKEGLNGARS